MAIDPCRQAVRHWIERPIPADPVKKVMEGPCRLMKLGLVLVRV